MRLITLLAVLALTSCANYQFGDVTKRLLEARATYCETTDPEIKAANLLVIRTYAPDYPEHSICEPGFLADVVVGIGS